MYCTISITARVVRCPQSSSHRLLTESVANCVARTTCDSSQLYRHSRTRLYELLGHSSPSFERHSCTFASCLASHSPACPPRCWASAVLGHLVRWLEAIHSVAFVIYREPPPEVEHRPRMTSEHALVAPLRAEDHIIRTTHSSNVRRPQTHQPPTDPGLPRRQRHGREGRGPQPVAPPLSPTLFSLIFFGV